ncbi:unnamed protein product, partial [Tetraodon nigroviridis]
CATLNVTLTDTSAAGVRWSQMPLTGRGKVALPPLP